MKNQTSHPARLAAPHGAAEGEETAAGPSLSSLTLPPLATASEPVPLFNRELSWLEFNQRVFEEAIDPTVPLLERVRFLAIASNNLDEFFMVRVGSLRDMISAGIKERSADGLTPKQQLKAVRARARRLLGDMYDALREDLLPELKANGIRIVGYGSLSAREQSQLSEHFEQQIAPILTPLAFDPGHPFPFLANLSLNLAIQLENDRGEEHVVFLKLPTNVPRLIRIGEGHRYLPLGPLIAEHLGPFFPGLRVRTAVPFRVIRNADISIREDEVQQDLLQTIEAELRRRERKEVVWLEIGSEADESLIGMLAEAMKVERADIFRAPGLLKLSDLMQIHDEVKKPALREPPFNPRIPSQLATSEDIFSIIRKRDVLLHRPFDSFTPVVEFVQAAADDPGVVAIKLTLYRSDRSSPIIEALMLAAQQGKQVTVVVELQARFDEMKNIAWARRLEQSGVQVVYGLVGLKTHCKLCLVVRREEGRLRRYVHLSTGNYNAMTAAHYTDIDLFTVNEEIGEDTSTVMNLLTGFSLASAQDILDHSAPGLEWKRLVVAPMDYHRWVIEQIEREAAHAKAGRPAGIAAKMNSLVDAAVIEALYKASQAGVKIDLLIRGICCLVPGLPDVSANIRVVSVVDRFLEHSRIYHFLNGGDEEVWVSSGDWMPRNFFRRIEVTYPILDPEIRRRLTDEVLAIGMADDTKGWRLLPDGQYERRTGGRIRSQEKLIEITRSEAVPVGPYEESLKRPASIRKKAKQLRKKSSR